MRAREPKCFRHLFGRATHSSAETPRLGCGMAGTEVKGRKSAFSASCTTQDAKKSAPSAACTSDWAR